MTMVEPLDPPEPGQFPWVEDLNDDMVRIARGIVNVRVVDGQLVVDRANGTSEAVGSIIGPEGPQGDRGLPGLEAMPQAEGMAAHILADGPVRDALMVSSSSVTVRRGATNHRALIQAAIDTGAQRVIVPPLDPANPATPWTLDDELIPKPGQWIDASAAVIYQPRFDRPAFYVPPGCDDVRIDVRYCAFPPPYVTWGMYGTGSRNGATIRASHSGIMSYGARGRFRGRFSGFRNAVRLGTWNGLNSTWDGLRDGNVVDVLVHDVDFGVVYFGQRGHVIRARGSYRATVGTDDPPHLIYATLAEQPSIGGVIIGDAWDSTGGCPFMLKGYSGLSVPSLSAHNTPGILQTVDDMGDVIIGSIIGTEIQTVVDGALVESIRGGLSVRSETYRKMVGSARISLASGIAPNMTRAAALNAGWSFGQLDVDYDTALSSTAQSLVHVYGNGVKLGATTLRNRNLTPGAGVRGINFAAATIGHQLAIAPVMEGVTDGVTIAPTAGGTFVVDESLMTRTTKPLVHTPTNLLATIRGAGGGYRLRTNYHYATPRGPLIDVLLTRDREVAQPEQFDFAGDLVQFTINVRVAAAGGIIRMGLRADSGTGAPGALIVEAGTVDASAIGEKQVTFAANDLPPGTYWLSYAAQGADGIQVRGVAASMVRGPSPTGGESITGQVPYQNGVTGALPAGFTFGPGTSAGVARIGYKVVV